MSTAYSKFLQCHDVCRSLLRGKSSCYVIKEIQRKQEASENHRQLLESLNRQSKPTPVTITPVKKVETFKDGQPVYQPVEESDDIYNSWGSNSSSTSPYL